MNIVFSGVHFKLINVNSYVQLFTVGFRNVEPEVTYFAVFATEPHSLLPNHPIICSAFHIFVTGINRNFTFVYTLNVANPSLLKIIPERGVVT